jgi:hypothetical protein
MLIRALVFIGLTCVPASAQTCIQRTIGNTTYTECQPPQVTKPTPIIPPPIHCTTRYVGGVAYTQCT